MTIDIDQAALDLEALAQENDSTAYQGIDQEDGSVLELKSVRGATCEKTVFGPDDRLEAGWPAPPEDEG